VMYLTMCRVDVSCPMSQLVAGDVFDDVPGRCELSDASALSWRRI
jgi:hypothetical protein